MTQGRAAEPSIRPEVEHPECFVGTRLCAFVWNDDTQYLNVVEWFLSASAAPYTTGHRLQFILTPLHFTPFGKQIKISWKSETCCYLTLTNYCSCFLNVERDKSEMETVLIIIHNRSGSIASKSGCLFSSRKRSDLFWEPPSLLCNKCQALFSHEQSEQNVKITSSFRTVLGLKTHEAVLLLSSSAIIAGPLLRIVCFLARSQDCAKWLIVSCLSACPSVRPSVYM
jgi:hypothetical protein